MKPSVRRQQTAVFGCFAAIKEGASVLPVVIDICGVSCGQKEVHKEAGRCTVRGLVVCKLGKKWVCHRHIRVLIETAQSHWRYMALEQAAA